MTSPAFALPLHEVKSSATEVFHWPRPPPQINFDRFDVINDATAAYLLNIFAFKVAFCVAGWLHNRFTLALAGSGEGGH